MALPIEITIGSGEGYDPGINQTDFGIPVLAGKQFYVSRSGFGIMPYNTYTNLSGGGFRLLGGLKTSSGEQWYVTITSSITEYSTNSSYTNGYNYSRVINALMPRIGFRQSGVSGYDILDSENQESLSGRYFNDFHSLISTKNLKQTFENSSISDSDFNTYIRSLKSSVIMRCLNGVLNTPEAIERVLTFNRSGDNNDELVSNSDLFVGFKIRTPKNDKISIQIERVNLLFDGNISFNLYLFQDGKNLPVWYDNITAVANEVTVVNLSDVIINYLSSGSIFYLGYFQNDLGSVKAIQEGYECFNKTICYAIDSMYASRTSGVEFDRTNIYLTNLVFGLNPEIRTFRDHTNLILMNTPLFDELIGLQMAYNILEQILYSSRSNADERILKDQIDKVGLQLELLGAAPVTDGPSTTGLKQRIERELKRVKQSFYPSNRSQIVSLW